MKKFIHQRKRSFEVAWEGLILLFSTETHAKIHLIAAVLVITLGWLFSVTPLEWVALIVAIGLVVQAEIWNTVLEKMSDFVQPEWDTRIKVIKDLSASGVLWCVIVSVTIGLIVFVPYVVGMLQR